MEIIIPILEHLRGLCTGSNNSFFGSSAGHLTTGSSNTFISFSAGDANTTGSNNTIIGNNADVATNNLTNAAAIGNGAIVNASNKIRLGNGSVTVVEGPVAYTVSDARFKTNIQEDVKGLDFIMKLRPITYQLKSKELDLFLAANNERVKKNIELMDYSAAATIQQSGFIAQEVETAANE